MTSPAPSELSVMSKQQELQDSCNMQERGRAEETTCLLNGKEVENGRGFNRFRTRVKSSSGSFRISDCASPTGTDETRKALLQDETIGTLYQEFETTSHSDGSTIPCPKCSLFASYIAVFVSLEICLFLALMSYSPPHIIIRLGYEDVTTMLASADSYWYESMLIKQSVEQESSRHNITLKIVDARELNIHNVSFEMDEEGFDHKHVGIVKYLYLLEGSEVNTSICLETNITSALDEKIPIYVFDRSEAYNDFVNYIDMHVPLQTFYLSVGSLANPRCHEVNFVANKTAFYFVAGNYGEGLWFQYNSSIFMLYYEISDYRDAPTCEVFDNTCELVLDSTGVSTSSKFYHLLGFVEPNDKRYNTSILHIHVMKRFSIVVIPLTVLLVSILVIIGVYCVYYKACGGRIRRLYSRIN